MKLGIELFKLNPIIDVVIDSKANKVYTIDVASQKFYSRPQNAKFNATSLSVIFCAAIAMFIRGFVEQYRSQLYLNEGSQFLKIVLIGIGILAGVMVFCLGLIAKNKNPQRLAEYLLKYPLSEEVYNMDNINKIVEKSSIVGALSLFLIVGSAIGSVMMFGQFLSNSSLITYFWAVLLVIVSSLLFAGIRGYLFMVSLKPKKPSENK